MGRDRPSFVEFRDDLDFPSCVRGPRLFLPLTLAASAFLGLVICNHRTRDVLETTFNGAALSLSVSIKL